MSDVTADPGETPAETADASTAVDLTAAPEAAAADVPPELVAQSLGQYFRAWWLRVRSGNSGVLPVVLAIVVVAVSFQIANSKFLSAQNLVNLFEQSTIYMLLAMAEIFACSSERSTCPSAWSWGSAASWSPSLCSRAARTGRGGRRSS